MKNKFLRVALCLAVIISFVAGALPIYAQNNDTAAEEATDIFDGIIAYTLERSGAQSVQEWIDGELTNGAGIGSEWYVIALRQSADYDFSSYKEALLKYLEKNEVRSASTRLKYALALCAVDADEQIICDIAQNAIGQQGIMSWVYGLHILNNGYTCPSFTQESVINELLALQLDDGGWAVSGQNGDSDVTAMTVQALAPHYNTTDEIKNAVDKALALLSSRQLDTGDYSSYGTPNAESCSQVIVALSSLGIDIETDERFIKNGNTLLDGLEKYRLSDDSFCHTEGGDTSETATAQAFYSGAAYERMLEGKGSLYIFDMNNSEVESDEPASEDSPSEEAPQADKPDHSPVYEEKSGGVSYKVWVTGIAAMVLLIMKKRSVKNFLFIVLIAAALIAFIAFTDFSSAQDYYSGQAQVKDDPIGIVTLEIRCDTVIGKSNSEYIPQDGVILEKCEFEIESGETVYDILTQAAKQYGIALESSGAEGLRYISGIGYLYEFDFGDLSGWVYHVNGQSSSVGCDEYTLKDGDEISWLYTLELGNDIK